MAAGIALVAPLCQAQGLPGPGASHSMWQLPQYRTVELKPSPVPLEVQEDLDAPSRAALLKDARAVLERPATTALALIEGGKLIFEGYHQGASAGHRFISYSVAKSITALAVGEALCAGKIRSIDDAAASYAAELAGTAYGESSVRHLLMMSSGAKGGNAALHGQPHAGAFTAEMTGSKALSQQFKDYGARATSLFGSGVKSGTKFEYSNLDTAALASVVAGATGMEFPQWVQQTVVDKAGLADTSYWHLDRDGKAINYAAYNASLRDYVRIALRFRAVLRGDAGDDCLREFLREGTQTRLPTYSRSGFGGYGYQIWTDFQFGPKSAFWMLGYGGQRIAIDPASDRIMVTFAWVPEDSAISLFVRWARAN